MTIDPAAAPTIDVPIRRRAIAFESGLIGCPTWRNFVLEPEAAGAHIHTLRCLDEDGIALYVADPFIIRPDYEFEIGDSDAEALGITDPGDVLVLVVLTVRADPPEITANLIGPLLVNNRTGRGRQLVLTSDTYSTRAVVSA